jgi:mRNA interferase MazF
MSLQRGDIVLVQFPYTSGTGSKMRPALVVQSDQNNKRLSNVILAPITSTTHRQNEPTQFVVDPASAEGQGSGLKHPSVVTCENLSTVAQTLVKRRLGRLADPAMKKVNESLKEALGIA